MTVALFTALLLAPPTLDIRVEGDGYLRLGRGSDVVYTTRTRLTPVSGAVGTVEGDLLLPRLPIAGTVKTITIDLEGTVKADGATVGRIVLAIFPNGTKPSPAGSVLTSAIKPKLANPGEGIAGVIRTGAPPVTRTATPVVANETSEMKATVTIRARSEVEANQFTVGDIASIDGDPNLVRRIADVVMGPSPILGTERGLVTAHIVARIRYAGIDVNGVVVNTPSGASVVRKTQAVTPEQMVEAAIEAAKARSGLNIPLVATKKPGLLNAMPGQLEIAAEPGPVTATGISVSLTIKVDGKYAGSRSVLLVPEGGLTGVKSGDPVRIRMTCNGAVIEMDGKSSGSAWIGQTVTVTTVDGKSTLQGKLVAPGVVEVKA